SFLKAAAFYDIGNVWSKASKLGNGGYKAGIGVGIRVKTPVGPLMLDFGIPMNKLKSEDKKGGGKFHFSMSQSF
ncbi:MAG: BamA/TamA family outer membrane protein, partial [Candidatus Omnitrophica bacterium]|nr:BamA/TamA family outer membrane protein [Candidatus Omnitrophota bacterium]